MRNALFAASCLAILVLGGCGYLDDELWLEDEDFGHGLALEGQYVSGSGCGLRMGRSHVHGYGYGSGSYSVGHAGAIEEGAEDFEYEEWEIDVAEAPELVDDVARVPAPGPAEAAYYGTLAARGVAAANFASGSVESTGEEEIGER